MSVRARIKGFESCAVLTGTLKVTLWVIFFIDLKDRFASLSSVDFMSAAFLGTASYDNPEMIWRIR